jgi:CMP-N-acetylneuraminic acid synthetase
MVIILDTKAFIERGDYNFPEIVIYETPGFGSVDMDNPIDFEFAEFLVNTGKTDCCKPCVS